MERDYRLAMYALGIATILLVASGATAIAGASLSTDPPDSPTNETNSTQLNTDHIQQFNETVTRADDGNYTVQQAQRTCSGALRLDSPEHTNTSHQIGNVTVTLVSHHDSVPINEIGRQRLAELVVKDAGDRAGLSEYSHLEVQINQYYESTARNEPLDIAGIHVQPTDECLPSARGTVDLANKTVELESVHSDVEEVSLNYTDDVGVLERNDRELIERLIVADQQASYNVRTHLNATALQATVTESTAEGHIDLKLQRPDDNGSSVMVTIDLNAETVVHSWTEQHIDDSNIEIVGEDGRVESSNTTVQSDNATIDFDESNVTVVNETRG